MPRYRLYFFWVCIYLLSGCQFALGGVELKPINSSVQKPSNVAIYVAVKDGDRPVTELSESNFSIYENDKPLDKGQAQLTLLDRDIAAIHHVLVLVDLSGELDSSYQKQLTTGLESFVQTTTPTQSVSVFGFDGSERIWSLGEFQKGHSGAVELRDLRAGDPSRNLNGAVTEALKRLDAELMRQKRPVRVGTLVVFTKGPDVAGRATGDALYSAIEDTGYDVFAIGVQSEDNGYLDDIGSSGTFEAESLSGLGPVFQEAALALRAAYGRYYLVQYCSAARAGTPTMKLEVKYTNKEGEERSGDLELGFDASGFGPGCDPNSKPTFRVAAKDPWEMDTADEPEAPSPPAGNATPANPPSQGTSSTPPASPPTTEPGDDDDAIVPPPDKPGYE